MECAFSVAHALLSLPPEVDPVRPCGEIDAIVEVVVGLTAEVEKVAMNRLTKILGIGALSVLLVPGDRAEAMFGQPVYPYPGNTAVSVRVRVAVPYSTPYVYRPHGYGYGFAGGCGGFGYGCGGGIGGGSHGFGGGYGYGYGYGYGFGYGGGFLPGYRYVGGCHPRTHRGFRCGHQGVRFCGKRRRYKSFSLSLGIGGFRLGIRKISF